MWDERTGARAKDRGAQRENEGQEKRRCGKIFRIDRHLGRDVEERVRNNVLTGICGREYAHACTSEYAQSPS